MIKLKQLRKYYTGQRVYYTGLTSYNEEVKNAPGTVIAVGNSVTIELDQYHKPYINKYDLCYEIPAKQFGNAGIGDLKTGKKKVIPI